MKELKSGNLELRRNAVLMVARIAIILIEVLYDIAQYWDMNIELAFSKEDETTQLTIVYISMYAYAGLFFSKVHVF